MDPIINYAKDIVRQVQGTYSSAVRVFETQIPMSVRAAETSAEGTSLYRYDPNGKALQAYLSLTQDILRWETQENG